MAVVELAGQAVGDLGVRASDGMGEQQVAAGSHPGDQPIDDPLGNLVLEDDRDERVQDDGGRLLKVDQRAQRRVVQQRVGFAGVGLDDLGPPISDVQPQTPR
jgi:hypothetical protein